MDAVVRHYEKPDNSFSGLQSIRKPLIYIRFSDQKEWSTKETESGEWVVWFKYLHTAFYCNVEYFSRNNRAGEKRN